MQAEDLVWTEEDEKYDALRWQIALILLEFEQAVEEAESLDMGDLEDYADVIIKTIRKQGEE